MGKWDFKATKVYYAAVFLFVFCIICPFIASGQSENNQAVSAPPPPPSAYSTGDRTTTPPMSAGSAELHSEPFRIDASKAAQKGATRSILPLSQELGKKPATMSLQKKDTVKRKVLKKRRLKQIKPLPGPVPPEKSDLQPPAQFGR
jgi:hypothetical protein